MITLAPEGTFFFITMPCKYCKFGRLSRMTMKILIVDDNPAFTRICADTLRARFPGARIDIVVSVGRFFNDHWDTPYDVCIMGDELYAGRSAFRGMAPALKKKYPQTEILCNSDLKGVSEAEKAEKLAGMQLFARGPDGSIIAFGRQVCALMGYMRSMVVPRDEKMSIGQVRISVAPAGNTADCGHPPVSRHTPRPGNGTGADGPRSLGAQQEAGPLMLRSKR